VRGASRKAIWLSIDGHVLLACNMKTKETNGVIDAFVET